MLGLNDFIVGRAHRYWDTEVGGEPGAVAGGGSAYLHVVATGDVRGVGGNGVLLDYVNAARVDIYLVADLIVAKEGGVECDINEGGGWHKGLAEELGYVACHGIADECLVAAVGQQCPVACVGMLVAEELGCVLELDAIGFLGETPCAIASAAYLQ